MATFAITTSVNFHDSTFSTRTGADVYNINGGTLTIDCDTRYGTNTTTTTGSPATITISASLGGKFLIDSSNVRLIPFSSGSGTVPAADTSIVQGSVSAKLIGVWSAINSAPTTAGSTMPTSGYIKVRQKSGGNYASGALTNITATASGADIQGWIEVSCDEAGTLTVPRLGEFETRGGLFLIGTTTGTRGDAFALPTSGGSTFWLPGAWVEDGSGGYDYWPALNALTGGGFNTTNQGTDGRSRYCQCYAGYLRFGSDGTNSIGELPTSGRKVYIGSNILMNNTTSSRGAAAVPNATIGSRFETAVTGGGVLDLQYCSGEWYLNLAQSFSIDMQYVSMFDTWTISECASAVNLYNCGNGIYGSAGAGLDAPQFTLSQCYAGGTLEKCAFGRAGTIASGDNSVTITSCIGQDFIKFRFYQAMLRTNATLGFGCVVTTCDDLYFEGCQVSAAFNLITVSNSEWKDTIYIDREVSTTLTTYPTYSFSFSSGCNNIKIDGLTFGGYTNVHPYSGMFYVTGFSQNIKIRNIGTYASPLSCGSTNICAYLFVGATGGACKNIEFKRCYISSTRSGVYSVDNSYKDVRFINCAGDYADAPTQSVLELVQRGCCWVPSLTAQTSIYGTHWFDVFTSTTAGRLGIMMNEATANTSSQVTLSNGAAFTSAGGLYMPTIGHQAIFETPEYLIGITAFQNSAAIMAGGTGTNYAYQYQIDLNDGSGYRSDAGVGLWSADKTLTTLATALNGHTLDATLGFKLKVKITTSTTNTTAITSLYFLTSSTTTTQAYQYPLDVIDLTLTGLQTGSDVVILEAGTSNVLASADAISGTTYTYTYEAADVVDIGVFKQGYIPNYTRNLSIGSTDSTLPIAQMVDRYYIE